eukprot:617453-Pelagomonas_calceolata.AAC.3
MAASAAGPSAAKLPRREPSNPHQQIKVRAAEAAARVSSRGTSRARQQRVQLQAAGTEQMRQKLMHFAMTWDWACNAPAQYVCWKIRLVSVWPIRRVSRALGLYKKHFW